MSNGDDTAALIAYNALLDEKKGKLEDIANFNEATSAADKAAAKQFMKNIRLEIAEMEKTGIVQMQRVESAKLLEAAYKKLDESSEKRQLVAQQHLLVLKDQQALAEWQIINLPNLHKDDRQALIDRAKALEKEIVCSRIR